MGNRVIPVVSLLALDFSDLGVSTSETFVLADCVPAWEFGDGAVEVKVHDINLGGAATLAVVLRMISPSPEDPAQEFLGEVVAEVTLDASTSAPTLLLAGLAPGFGAHLQVQAVATQDSTARAIEATISVDLVLRDQVAPKPQVEGDFTIGGNTLTLATTSDPATTFQAHTTATGLFALNVGNTVAADRAALKHDHNAAAWIFRISGADTYRADASNLYPLVSGRDLGKSTDRWDEVFCETLNVDTEIAGIVSDTTHHCFNYTGTAKVYLPMQGSTTEATSISYLQTRLAPFNGRLVAVLVYSSGSAGTTVVGLHKNGSTTATETDSQTQSANTTTTYTFSSNSFSKGDRLHISLDATNAIGDVNVCCVWELDTRT